MKKIPLSKGMEACVNDDMYEYLNQWKWFYNAGYAIRWGTGSTKERKRIYMHRVIAGTSDNKFTDHIDGDRLNNVRENLRECNASQNQANRHLLNKNISGYRGVYWNKNEKKWRAHIKVNSIDIHLGYYFLISEAAKAYNIAALMYFGEFAKLNEIGGQ